MRDVGTALARARERFLDDGVLDHTDRVRPEILDSWQRSRSAGVDASRLQLPFDSDLERSGRLVACAGPVLDQLEDELSGSAVGVVLTDPVGRVLDRRVGEDELQRRLDDISLAPGFSYAEEFAGTNGVGTALSGRTATLVVGAEHFTDRLQGFACAGAPVLHPVDGRVVGLVDITCLRAEANDLMRVLALQAARDISHVLRERGSAGAREVMAAFQDACARTDGPVLALSEDFVMSNRAAQGILAAGDGDLLRRSAGEWMRSPALVERVDLANGAVRARTTPIVRRGRARGVVVELLPHAGGGTIGTGPIPTAPTPTAPTPTAPTPTVTTPAAPPPAAPRGLPGLAGSSASWRATCGGLRTAARRGRPTLVVGEPGTGKHSLVRAVHGQMRSPTARWVSVDAASPGPHGIAAAWRDALPPTAAAGRSAPADATGPEVTVVVRHVDQLAEADTAPLEALVADIDAGGLPGWWVVGLVTRPADTEAGLPPAALVAGMAERIVVAPLRHRPEDVAPLVDALLRRHAPGRRPRCTPAAGALLTGARWPGNVAELSETLRAAVAARPSGEIGPEDLPGLEGGTRRRLSLLEALERDLIVTALTEAGGNRSQAAAILGMGRATLYRRLRAFGIQDVGR